MPTIVAGHKRCKGASPHDRESPCVKGCVKAHRLHATEGTNVSEGARNGAHHVS